MLPRGTLDRPALLLVKIGHDVAARGEDALAELGLSGRQYMVLGVLSADTPPSQQELAGLCGLLPAQVVIVVDELERRGLAERQRSETDRRRSVVSLTEAGATALARADELGKRLVAELDPQARQAAIDALSRP
ncbi:MarR family transcriptional regulator [Solirubrobacter phytolaccae]|uniref:MarR family transcriptional regulator n=1 Tax=Solirubrobacter phytolaccae TaxID=1404360 RepID=A0A9X3S723_9ACTN|nr:MarR family transcriptional regulator [Solirubrobacter phytolaccae]MDA0179808.1 MarR family transcriptional regulator [Solirubrobacter phytolaccae]